MRNSVLDVRIAERSVKKGFRKKLLLRDINFQVKTREMVMILGGSGAGKTTLMNAIMGYEQATGRIRFDRYDVYKDYRSVKHMIGFVPQSDLMRENDTVYDTLRDAAKIKLPQGVGAELQRKRVLEVLAILGLQREAFNLVSKLSGGQRKRLSIALEYISDPALFFLDEPDSGLDGVMAKALAEKLRVIANKGTIVMSITHSPDRIKAYFDKVIVLAKSNADNAGHLTYFGNIPGAFSWFRTNSLEGVVKRLNRKDEGGDGLADHYIESYAKNIHRNGIRR